jgi:hypothetical protein
MATLRASLNMPGPMPSRPNLSATLAKPGAAGEVAEDEEDEEDEELEDAGKALSIVRLTADLIISPMAIVTPTMQSTTTTQTIVKRLTGRTSVCGSKTCA